MDVTGVVRYINWQRCFDERCRIEASTASTLSSAVRQWCPTIKDEFKETLKGEFKEILKTAIVLEQPR